MSSSEVEDTVEDDQAAAPVEVDEQREGVVAAFRDRFGDAVVGSHVDPGVEVWVRVTADVWQAAGEFARDELGCTYFDFLSAVDWQPSPFGRDMDAQEDLVAEGTSEAATDDSSPPEDGEPSLASGVAGGETRFQLLARVHAPDRGFGIFLKCDVPGDRPAVDTWVPVYAGANWHERETAEMFGIDFVGHPNLIRLYLPGAFEGHPLRKDFPLLARRVKPWPGIVDVEQMPESAEQSGGADTSDGST